VLRPTLHGMAKFGHLISVEYFSDITNIVKDILLSFSKDLSVLTAFECIYTVFVLLGGHVQYLSIDLKEFYNLAYTWINCIPMGIANGSNEEELVLILQKTLSLMFGKTAQNSLSRVSAFVKRIASITLLFSNSSCVISMLDTIKLIIIRYPKLDCLFDKNSERSCSNGVYNSFLDDPELCNGLGAGIWELDVLRNHWHPKVRQWIVEFSKKLAE
jgi:nucleolar complex protein 3